MKSDDSPWGPLWAVCLRVRTHIGQYHGPAAIVMSKMNNKLARLLLLFIPFFGSFQVSSGVVLSTAPIFGFSSRRPRQEERMISTVRTVQYRIHNFWTNFQLTFAVHWQVTKKKKKKMGQKTGAENWGRKRKTHCERGVQSSFLRFKNAAFSRLGETESIIPVLFK